MTPSPVVNGTVQLDALLPAEMAARAEQIGARKAAMDFLSTFVDTARVVPGTVVEATYFGDMTYYSIAIDSLEKPVTVSMRNTIGRRNLAAGEKVEIGWSPESMVPLS